MSTTYTRAITQIHIGLLLMLDITVFVSYQLCVFTGPGFVTDYVEPFNGTNSDVEIQEMSDIPAVLHLQDLENSQIHEEGIERKENKRQEVRWEYCETCRVNKYWYAHHCFICNRCVIRMDHHCRKMRLTQPG